MKVVVVSDSHGLTDVLQKVLDDNQDADLFIHCGDICLDTDEFPQFHTVAGNNDFNPYPLELTFNVGRHRIIALHSHTVGFYHREAKMIKKAKDNNCDILCFGHSHIAEYEVKEGVHILNPGSLYHARDGRAPSYARMYLDDDNVNVEFIFLD